MAEKYNNFYIVAHDYIPLVNQVWGLYSKHPKVRVHKFDSYLAAMLDVEVTGEGLVLYTLSHMDHIKYIVAFNEGIKRLIRQKKVRVICLHNINHPKIKRLLKKIGCSEIFNLNISIQFTQKLLEKYLGKSALSAEEKELLYQSEKIAEIHKEETLKSKQDFPDATVQGVRANKFPQALDFSIPDSELNSEQQKVRSYYLAICPEDKELTSYDPKTAPFGLVEEESKKKSFIFESVDASPSVTVWTKDREFVLKTKMIQKNKNEFRLTFSEEADSQEFLELLATGKFQRVFLKFDLKRGSIFFNIDSPELEDNKDELVVDLPNRMWKIQRRRFHRLTLNPNEEHMVSLKMSTYRQGEEFQRKIIDISSEGARLKIFDHEKEVFAPGSVIDIFRFEIEEQIFNCAATVVWCASIEGHDGTYVGVQFQGLTDEFKEQISLFVLEETFSYWEKYYP